MSASSNHTWALLIRRLVYIALLISTSWAISTENYDEFLFSHGKPIVNKDHDNRVYFAAEIEDFDSFAWTSRFTNWTFEQPIGYLKDHYLFSMAKDSMDESMALIGAPGSYFNVGIPMEISADMSAEKPASTNSIPTLLLKRHLEENDQKIKHLEFLTLKKLVKKAPIPDVPMDSSFEVVKAVQDRLHIEDPGFIKQWHLVNPTEIGNDLNVTGVWYQGNTGQNSTVAVVDDGLDMDHEDLKHNYFPEGSWDFNDNGPEPRPRLSDDRHGTRCCGEIAAARNHDCGVGIAYESRIAGIRILSGFVTDADEAIALNYAMDKNDIYSCSWGPPDNGKAMDAPGTLVRKSLLNGVQHGRNDKGSVFVFASGNGASFGDNCNFDGYTNSIYSITVAAIDRKNQHPYYSEPCSANMIVTYSSGTSDHIYTTDVHGGCTNGHGGTSAAAPIAAGVFALVLTARPELSWRDLQYLSWETAVPFNLEEPGWQLTTAGKMFHHKYGYGKLDAYGIVERAKTWDLVKPQAWLFSDEKHVHKAIKFNRDKEKGGVFSVITVTEEDLKKANLERLEHVNVLMNIDFSIRGALSIYLESPDGLVSELAPPRYLDTSNAGVKNWTFMSVVHWGERGVGNWTVHVYNSEKEEATGEFLDWTLKLWGSAEDASKARLYEFEEEKKQPISEPDRPSSTIEPAASSTSLVVTPPTSTSISSEPSPDSTSSVIPSATVPVTNPVNNTDGSAEASATPHHSIFPTFGLSRKHLAWIYGSFVLIALFVSSLVAYLCIQKRRKRNQQFRPLPTDSTYEFELVSAGEGHDESHSFLGSQDDDDDGLSDISDESRNDGVEEETKRLRYDFYHGEGRAAAAADRDQSSGSGTETSTGSPKAGATIGQKARSLYDDNTKSQDRLKNGDTEEEDKDTNSSTVLFAVDSEVE